MSVDFLALTHENFLLVLASSDVFLPVFDDRPENFVFGEPAMIFFRRVGEAGGCQKKQRGCGQER